MKPKEFEQFLKNLEQNNATEYQYAVFRRWLLTLSERDADEALSKYTAAFTVEGNIDPHIRARIQHAIEGAVDAMGMKDRERAKNRNDWWKVAACVAALLLAISFTYYKLTDEQMLADNLVETMEVVPGSNQATLKLANGSSIPLSSTADGVINDRNMATGFVKAGGELSYVSINEGVVEDNTLQTPRGGQYRLVLPDGTKVWLNASSSITFPSRFNGESREVSITGEAYLEVAKHADAPFVVHTDLTNITVLGTALNVAAYPDDHAVTTTLVSGSVRIDHKEQSMLMKPGQQVKATADKALAMKQVEAYYAVAWKEGLFMFNQESITIVMDKIARWYDIEVVYDGPKPTKKFWGTVSRFDQVDEVLAMLEATGGVHFVKKERRITVQTQTN